jgi:hypothetical protein
MTPKTVKNALNRRFNRQTAEGLGDLLVNSYNGLTVNRLIANGFRDQLLFFATSDRLAVYAP